MSPKAELVKQISANGFKEAIDLMACLAVLREGESLILPRTLEAANATRAAIIVQRALLQRVLMTVERAAPSRTVTLGWRLPTCRTGTYLMKLRMLDREHFFTMRAIDGAISMQTPDAND